MTNTEWSPAGGKSRPRNGRVQTLECLAILLDSTGSAAAKPSARQFRDTLRELSLNAGCGAVLVTVIQTGRLGRAKFARALRTEGWNILEEFVLLLKDDVPSVLISASPELQRRALDRALPSMGRLKRNVYHILQEFGLWPAIERYHLYRAQRSAEF